MIDSALRKLYFGFIFVMLSFRIQGFDLLPSIIGYILFAFAFRSLEKQSDYFSLAFKYNIPLIIVSIFSIYQNPSQATNLNFSPLSILVILISLISITLSLLVVYNLFMGIRDMAAQRDNDNLANESVDKWKQYMYLQVAFILAFILAFVPFLSIVFIFGIFVFTFIVLFRILGFIKRCEANLNTL